MKDNFSSQAKLYANFRPHYPYQLYDFIYSNVRSFAKALDIATGNGQVAVELAKKFTEVHATDISAKQLSEAPAMPNIYYKVESAEDASFPENFFDLITVAQAIHWFDFEKFYSTAKKILKPQGIIVVIGYGLLSVNEKVDQWLHHYYKNITGPYWDKERKYIDDLYNSIPFPFAEIATPKLKIEYQWTKDQFIGYLNTWSAVQHFIKANNTHPLTQSLLNDLDDVWADNVVQSINFPLLLKAGHQ